jgi:pyruvate/2-oxoglutarate/acetoin dehydrogenase E1 component
MPRNISFKQAVNEALDLEMSRGPSVILMGMTSSAAPAATRYAA